MTDESEEKAENTDSTAATDSTDFAESEEKSVIHLSVRDLTGFLCRGGSLDSRAGIQRLVEGTRLHSVLQSRAGAGYRREVTLSRRFSVGDLCFELNGRADGIIDEGDAFTIDEIKTTTQPLRFIRPEDYPAYQAQAECYACMFALNCHLDFIRTRLTFANLETEDVTYFYEEYTVTELTEKVTALLTSYRKWHFLHGQLTQSLNESAKALHFPYRSFREGQYDLVLAVYRAIKRKERLFAEAPTGIGKTISTLYPAVKRIGEGIGKRIFYFTAKNTQRKAAAAALERMRKHGLHIRSISLTAKEKICFCPETVENCDSMMCQYSDDYYAKVNDALYELLSSYEHFDREIIELTAKTYKICPYELSLDLAEWCEVILCDYNYLMDRAVCLRRFFGDFCNPDDNIFLMDEAHNLVSRARDTYSAELFYRPFLELYHQIPESDFVLYSPVKNLCRVFLKLKRHADDNPEGGGGFYMSEEPFDGFGEAVGEFVQASREWSKINGGLSATEVPFAAEVKRLTYAAYAYSMAAESADSKFRFYVVSYEGEIQVKVLCIDPSSMLSKRLSCGRCAVLFSATLTPPDYFSDVLGGNESGVKSRTMVLPSPFPRENLMVGIMAKVSTRYADRDNTVIEVADILSSVIMAHGGNYIAYFPSYRLMRECAKAFRAVDPYTRCIMQKAEMTESDREAFLKKFENPSEERPMLAFAVLGGVFGEGIDLVGERLVGSIIVGVGLAQINTESNIIAAYYAERSENGYPYAYLYPGMNKVLQAAGRVIRSDSDRGIVLLIDDRFATRDYVSLFPKHWKGIRLFDDTLELEDALEQFWNK